MTDGQCDICKKKDRRLVSVVSKTMLFHVCSDCFFERFMARRETGAPLFEEGCRPGGEEFRPLEYVR